jgi:guanosine-3',5'-bis(diphosphate) 3'-pyrophosphohydrolase
MAKRYTKEENDLIESAIIFLVDEYRKSGNNPKPVIFHSLRVSMKLADLGEDVTIVVAALLHDLTEDSDVSSMQISQEFSVEIANLVDSVSFKSNITDKHAQYREMFKRTVFCGLPAMKIKCVDILDNSEYYVFGNNKEAEKLLLAKLEYFLDVTQEYLNKFMPYNELCKKYERFILEYKQVYLTK